MKPLAKASSPHLWALLGDLGALPPPPSYPTALHQRNSFWPRMGHLWRLNTYCRTQMVPSWGGSIQMLTTALERDSSVILINGILRREASLVPKACPPVCKRCNHTFRGYCPVTHRGSLWLSEDMCSGSRMCLRVLGFSLLTARPNYQLMVFRGSSPSLTILEATLKTITLVLDNTPKNQTRYSFTNSWAVANGLGIWSSTSDG